jgi:hypothetical protein
MPPIHRLVVAGVVASVAGCVEEPPAPNISRLSVSMRWNGDTQRSVDVSIVDPDIPCTEVEEGFLGESAVECKSAQWSVTVDGVEVGGTPVTCWSAHDGLFGHVPKRCQGGKATAVLPDVASDDVEIVATTAGDENRIVLAGVRRTHTFVQERPFQGGEPGLGRAQDLTLVSDVVPALYMQAGKLVLSESAYTNQSSQNSISLSPHDIADGTYTVRVLVQAQHHFGTIAVPVEGSLTVGP